MVQGVSNLNGRRSLAVLPLRGPFSSALKVFPELPGHLPVQRSHMARKLAGELPLPASSGFAGSGWQTANVSVEPAAPAAQPAPQSPLQLQTVASSSPFANLALDVSHLEDNLSLDSPQHRDFVATIETLHLSARASSMPNLILVNKLGKFSLSAQLGGSRSPAECRIEAHERAVSEQILAAERASFTPHPPSSLLRNNSQQFRQAFLSSLASSVLEHAPAKMVSG